MSSTAWYFKNLRLWQDYARYCLTAPENICLGDIRLPAHDNRYYMPPGRPGAISQVRLADYIFVKGYEVVIAHDGDEALELADATRFDLVILDIMLPGHRRLRGVPAAPGQATTSPCCSCPRGTPSWTRSSASSSAATTISPSRSASASCRRA